MFPQGLATKASWEHGFSRWWSYKNDAASAPLNVSTMQVNEVRYARRRRYEKAERLL